MPWYESIFNQKRYDTCIIFVRKLMRDNPKIFTKSQKNILISEKKIQIVVIFGNHRYGIIESTNIPLQIPNKIANPRIAAKSRKYFANRKIYLVTCHFAPDVSQRQFRFPPFCCIQNGGEAVVGKCISQRFATDLGACLSCMIRVNCGSTLGLFAGIMNPYSAL